MSFVKMTDILVSTKAFIVTLTHPAKAKSLREESAEIIIEVTPIIQAATQEANLAEKFFEIITADSTSRNRRLKEENLKHFVTACSKQIFEQFWDSSHWKSLEQNCLRIPHITCLLYDVSGNVVNSVICRTLDLLWALQKIEEAFFTHSLPAKSKKVPYGVIAHEKKEYRRNLNRETHKYFLHHRSPR